MTDAARAAVLRFRAAPEQAEGEWPGKVDAIAALEPEIADVEVLEFLLAVLANPAEYDLARVEVAKLLTVADVSREVARTRCSETLCDVLASVDDDALVRQWAANAARALASPDLLERLVSVVADADDDLDVRHNALASLALHALSPALMERLAPIPADGALGAAVRRFLEQQRS